MSPVLLSVFSMTKGSLAKHRTPGVDPSSELMIASVVRVQFSAMALRKLAASSSVFSCTRPSFILYASVPKSQTDRQTSPVCHSQTSTSPSSLCFRLLHNRCKHCMCGHWFSSLSPSGNERVCVAISHLRALHPYRAGIQCFLKQCGLCHLPPSRIFLLLSPLLHIPLHPYPGSGSDIIHM